MRCDRPVVRGTPHRVRHDQRAHRRDANTPLRPAAHDDPCDSRLPLADTKVQMADAMTKVIDAMHFLIFRDFVLVVIKDDVILALKRLKD